MRVSDGRNRGRTAGPVLEEIGVSAARDRYSSYPSRGLTPERLAEIFREADAGDVGRQAELFDEMEEKDAHLSSVLATRKLSVAGLDYEIVPPEGNGGQENFNGRVAEFVREALSRIDNWEEALLDMLDAVGKGFSVSEIMWEASEGIVWIKELRWRHQKKFTFLTPALITPTISLPRQGGGRGWGSPPPDRSPADLRRGAYAQQVRSPQV